MQIVIILEGGIVQEVVTDIQADVVVVDRDTEGCDPEELRSVEGQESYIYCGLTEAKVDIQRVKTICPEAGRLTSNYPIILPTAM